MLDFLVFTITMVSVWAVVALSLNLQFGLTGLVNFGQILPFALGASGTAIAALHALPIWVGAVLGVALAVAASLVVLAPVARLSQDYWALVTLGAAELFRLLMINVPAVAGGADGASVPRVADPATAMTLAVALLIAALLVGRRIDRSPLGRFLRVIREDEMLAAALGRNAFRFQATIMALSWSMAGAAGVLYAHIIGYVAPASFTVAETFVVWTAVILGGSGSLFGALLGTTFIEVVTVSTRFVAGWSGQPFALVANLRLALFGLILVLVFLVRPEGLWPERKVATRVVGS